MDSIAKGIRDNAAVTPRPSPPVLPATSFELMEGRFHHPTYGLLSPCYVRVSEPSPTCADALAHHVVQSILNASSPDVPTLIVPFKRTFSTHLRLAHFSGNLFNASVVWSNHDVRRAEGHTQGEDVLVGLDNRFVVEWVPRTGAAGDGDGWAFSGDFWGKEGEVRELEGGGRARAEVWFERIE